MQPDITTDSPEVKTSTVPMDIPPSENRARGADVMSYEGSYPSLATLSSIDTTDSQTNSYSTPSVSTETGTLDSSDHTARAKPLQTIQDLDDWHESKFLQYGGESAHIRIEIEQILNLTRQTAKDFSQGLYQLNLDKVQGEELQLILNYAAHQTQLKINLLLLSTVLSKEDLLKLQNQAQRQLGSIYEGKKPAKTSTQGTPIKVKPAKRIKLPDRIAAGEALLEHLGTLEQTCKHSDQPQRAAAVAACVTGISNIVPKPTPRRSSTSRLADIFTEESEAKKSFETLVESIVVRLSSITPDPAGISQDAISQCRQTIQASIKIARSTNFDRTTLEKLGVLVETVCEILGSKNKVEEDAHSALVDILTKALLEHDASSIDALLDTTKQLKTNLEHLTQLQEAEKAQPTPSVATIDNRYLFSAGVVNLYKEAHDHFSIQIVHKLPAKAAHSDPEVVANTNIRINCLSATWEQNRDLCLLALETAALARIHEFDGAQQAEQLHKQFELFKSTHFIELYQLEGMAPFKPQIEPLKSNLLQEYRTVLCHALENYPSIKNLAGRDANVIKRACEAAVSRVRECPVRTDLMRERVIRYLTQFAQLRDKEEGIGRSLAEMSDTFDTDTWRDAIETASEITNTAKEALKAQHEKWGSASESYLAGHSAELPPAPDFSAIQSNAIDRLARLKIQQREKTLNSVCEQTESSPSFSADVTTSISELVSNLSQSDAIDALSQAQIQAIVDPFIRDLCQAEQVFSAYCNEWETAYTSTIERYKWHEQKLALESELSATKKEMIASARKDFDAWRASHLSAVLEKLNAPNGGDTPPAKPFSIKKQASAQAHFSDIIDERFPNIQHRTTSLETVSPADSIESMIEEPRSPEEYLAESAAELKSFDAAWGQMRTNEQVKQAMTTYRETGRELISTLCQHVIEEVTEIEKSAERALHQLADEHSGTINSLSSDARRNAVKEEEVDGKSSNTKAKVVRDAEIALDSFLKLATAKPSTVQQGEASSNTLPETMELLAYATHKGLAASRTGGSNTAQTMANAVASLSALYQDNPYRAKLAELAKNISPKRFRGPEANKERSIQLLLMLRFKSLSDCLIGKLSLERDSCSIANLKEAFSRAHLESMLDKNLFSLITFPSEETPSLETAVLRLQQFPNLLNFLCSGVPKSDHSYYLDSQLVKSVSTDSRAHYDSEACRNTFSALRELRSGAIDHVASVFAEGDIPEHIDDTMRSQPCRPEDSPRAHHFHLARAVKYAGDLEGRVKQATDALSVQLGGGTSLRHFKPTSTDTTTPRIVANKTLVTQLTPLRPPLTETQQPPAAIPEGENQTTLSYEELINRLGDHVGSYSEVLKNPCIAFGFFEYKRKTHPARYTQIGEIQSLLVNIYRVQTSCRRGEYTENGAYISALKSTLKAFYLHLKGLKKQLGWKSELRREVNNCLVILENINDQLQFLAREELIRRNCFGR